MKHALFWSAILAHAVAAFPFIPEPTVFAPVLDVWSPEPTAAPPFPGYELFKRQQDNVGNNTCGFISGSSDNPLTCTSSNFVCAKNTWFGVQGCCTSAGLQQCVLPSTCIPKTAMSTACTDQACSTNAGIARCTSAALTECQTMIVIDTVSATTMTEYGCAASRTILTAQRWLQGSAAGTEGTKVVTVTAPAATSPTGTAESDSKSSPIGAIVGGTVGGCVFLCVVALAIFLAYRRGKSKRNGSTKKPVTHSQTHYHQPSMTEYTPSSAVPGSTVEYNPTGFQNRPTFENWVEEDHKLWAAHQRYQAQRPSGEYNNTDLPMPNYPGMAHSNVVQLDSYERPVEAPYPPYSHHM